MKLSKTKQNSVIGATLEFVRLRDVHNLISSLTKNHKVTNLYSLFNINRTAYYRCKHRKSYDADRKYNPPQHEIPIKFIRNFKWYGGRRIKASLELA